MNNSELYYLYNSLSAEFKSVLNLTTSKHQINGPYLCSPSKEYWGSKIRIVFVGQETNGWSSHADVSRQMQTYTNFGLGEKYFSSPFWNVIRKIEKGIVGQHYCCASLNLNKFDINGRPPRAPFLATIEKLDHILNAEIQLLKPDVLIFFTGPKYDERITKLFDTNFTEVNGFGKRELAEIRLRDSPYKLFRTYHPNYLRRSGLEKKVISQIVFSVSHQ